MMRLEAQTETATFIACNGCGQALALRLGPNHYRVLGADVIPSPHARQVFVCPVCGKRTRVPRCDTDGDVIHNG